MHTNTHVSQDSEVQQARKLYERIYVCTHTRTYASEGMPPKSMNTRNRRQSTIPQEPKTEHYTTGTEDRALYHRNRIQSTIPQEPKPEHYTVQGMAIIFLKKKQGEKKEKWYYTHACTFICSICICMPTCNRVLMTSRGLEQAAATEPAAAPAMECTNGLNASCTRQPPWVG